ncbi:unnamed protein product [Bursaphelenchus okinawaensis]|uniref:Uncharacterized protein n=1 Tax=Bursaphelenchus okinawaensis TaxID=465554 RepID=A0A811L9K1_9BILA|nr:unnamed protein product [Bursaphelenchus okinawaensis]CAG9119219.1 unnamed protein product [Bursaphelenchus okinawaensis]
MGPTPNEPSRQFRTDDDLNEFEQEGWQVGFDVQFNGVGAINIAGSDGEFTDSDGYEGPGDSDDEARREGYTTVPSTWESDEEAEEHTEVKAEEKNVVDSDIPQSSSADNLEGSLRKLDFVGAPIQKEFQKALEQAEAVHLKDSDFKVNSKSKDFHLSEEKVDEIKNVMSNFTLPPLPNWKDQEIDAKLLELIKKG